MRRPVLILIIMAVSFSLSDIHSPNPINGVIFPLLFAAACLILLLWSIRRFHSGPPANKNTRDAGNAFFLQGKHHNNDSSDNSGDGGSD